MTTRTEQESRRGAAVRGVPPKTAPKPGPRRPGVPHQSKPIPRSRPDAPETTGPGGTPASRERARPALKRRPSRGRQRAPFVLLVVGLMCGGLLSLLLLNTVLAQDSITAANLRKEIEVARQANEDAKLTNEKNMGPGPIADQAEMQGQHRDWDKPNVLTEAGAVTSQADQGR
ncbi:hypothetical protein [Nonomuraea aurantiaca]|uniref:hypothetical protein n=1 Tax=Nonomuraea aurantiaca TaxID=2878562 RepID=UPI001CD9C8DF|nr:hypothetical protein [Nonomuraea aurantiaca]MCA2222706.1 hypothetical protein [Nonomuraea aurantiaca]